MMETGQKAKSMDRDLKCIETETITQASLLLICFMVRENSNGQMDDRMLVSGSEDWNMEKESLEKLPINQQRLEDGNVVN